MRNKLTKFWDAGCCRKLMLGSRTIALLLLTLMLLVEARASSPQGALEVLGDMAQLEASMHSTVLSDLQEAQAVVSAAAQPSGFPDSSAVVGRMFQMHIPTKAKDSGSTVKE
ncbi:dystroglycan-like [Clarias magur]|uniref:Dystroglycan-like n=1 Tax=Clarias magur TaxID=1594786 RepID=A0A8J4U6N2_CLAMG|nr:dystroglycan-like [Clarias magur]